MGRIRTIKPELLEDERAAELSDAAWRLFVSALLLADDYGNLRASPKYLAAHVWQDTARARDVDRALAELAEARLMVLYEVDGQHYAAIRSWRKHQRIDNAGKRSCPPSPNEPVEGQDEETGTCSDSRGDPRRTAEGRGKSRRTSASLGGSPPDMDMERKGEERRERGAAASPPRPAADAGAPAAPLALGAPPAESCEERAAAESIEPTAAERAAVADAVRHLPRISAAAGAEATLEVLGAIAAGGGPPIAAQVRELGAVEAALIARGDIGRRGVLDLVRSFCQRAKAPPPKARSSARPFVDEPSPGPLKLAPPRRAAPPASAPPAATGGEP